MASGALEVGLDRVSLGGGGRELQAICDIDEDGEALFDDVWTDHIHHERLIAIQLVKYTCKVFRRLPFLSSI